MTEPELVDIIRNEIKTQNMTWRRLEDISGVARTCPQRWFHGNCSVTVFTLLNLMDALGLDMVITKKGKRP